MRRLLICLSAGMLGLISLPHAGARSAIQSETLTYTDFTPNPTVFGQCSGPEVPSLPTDVNGHEIKVTKKRATLTTTSHNTLDWAAEIRDSKGNVLASSDGPLPTDLENITLSLKKGTYTIYYCNWAGEPQITVDYTLK